MEISLQLKKKALSSIKVLSRPKILSLLSFSCFAVFLISTVITYAPIVKVEANYRYKKFLHNTLHIDNISAFFIPSIHFDLSSKSKYPQYGMFIPSLFMDEPVIFNVDPNNKDEYLPALKKGIAHAAGTQVPGNVGLGYYFAHSSSPDLVNQYNAVFYLLGKLQKGDEVDLWFNGQKYVYEVTELKETSPNDVSFLSQKYTKEMIVLQTCWPAGTTQRRLLVFAARK
jgi:LPXTG-site transpeptidase (sortase) family protein